MRWSIRYQLLVPLLTLLLGVVGMAVWTGLASAQRARRQIETQMRDIAATVHSVTFPRSLQTFKLMKGLSGAEFLLYEEDEPVTTLPAVPDSLPEPIDDWEELHLGPRVRAGDKTYFCQGIHLGQERSRILYIFYPESLWQDALWAAIRPSLYLGVVGGLGSVLLGMVLAQRLSRRIQEMERRTRLIAAGDFSPMPLPSRNDELRDLGKSVNEMAQQLAQFQETVKKTERLRLLGQVSGGLAHQLRNGVTGARLAVQLHAREANSQGEGGGEGEAERESLNVALRQLSLVEMHLKRFLDLGRASELNRVPCRLIALLDQTVALVRPQCRHAHIDLRWQSPSSSQSEPILHGDPDQLRHLLLNVLTNAIEAAGTGGWVKVDLRISDRGLTPFRTTIQQSAIIEISDSGPGPSPEVADRLFELFVTGKPEGVGLGLAVARQVAEAHGGSIGWRREAGHTCFRIELPCKPSQEISGESHSRGR